MTGTGIRTAHQAANDVRQRLEAAMRQAGFDTKPPVVAAALVEGVKITRIRLTSLTLEQAQWLTKVLGGQVPPYGQPSASEVRKELDEAMRTAGIVASPSSVVVSTVHGSRANKILPPSLSTPHAERLVRYLEGEEPRR